MLDDERHSLHLAIHADETRVHAVGHAFGVPGEAIGSEKARNSLQVSSKYMDRTFEEIRGAALELDRESQRKLADELEENLSETQAEVDAAWAEEIKRRLEKHRRGEMTYVTPEESIAKGRAIIEEYKHTHG